LLSLYREVLNMDLPWMQGKVAAGGTANPLDAPGGRMP